MSLFKSLQSLLNQIPDFVRSALGLKQKSYKLLEKTKKLSIKLFPKDSWAVPEDAETFTRVRILKTEEKDYWHEIVSFFNKEGKVIRKCEKGSHKPRVMRIFEHDFKLTDKMQGITSKKITTEKWLPDEDGVSRWHLISTEDQFIHMCEMDENSRFPRKVHITKTEFDQASGGDRFAVTMTEYPANLGAEPKSAKKVMGVTLELTEDGVPNIVGTVESSNVQFPTDDRFLAFRFLSGEKKQESLARFLLRDKGLAEADVSVKTSRCMVAENAVACFNSRLGAIYFKDVPRYSLPADTAAHEVEHAYQHAQIGRLNGGCSMYEKHCASIYPSLTDPAEIAEAVRYVQASLDYPRLSPTEDLSKNMAYQNNYLEVKAREAGEKVHKEYMKGRNFLVRQFNYVPLNYL